MEAEQLLTCALDIGEQMLISGAEIGRVEDSVRHICSAYGCLRTDVFTITSSIVVSVEDENRKYFTQTRRITQTHTDLTRLHRLNALSRQICREKPDYEGVQAQLKEICAQKTYPRWMEALASALVAGGFAVFFGGTWLDGLCSALLGVGLRYLTGWLGLARMNQIFTNVVASFAMSAAAIGLTRLGCAHHVDMVIIGNIMLLIPGIALTNSLRDMISGDIMSGMLRFFDAVLVAAAIAAGFVIAVAMMGGVL